MIFIVGALLTILGSISVALLLAMNLTVVNFVDISMMCGVLAKGDDACQAGAIKAGYVMLAGILCCLALTFALYKRFGAPGKMRELGCRGSNWILLGVVILLGAHIILDATDVKSLSRIEAIGNFSTFISLENLIWPLLLQLMNSSKTWRHRLLYFSVLLVLVSLSPYRGVLLAVLIFGMILPLVGAVINRLKQRGSQIKQRDALAAACIAILISGSLLFAIYSDTRTRATSIMPDEAQNELNAKLTQRLAYPLFQAHFAEQLVSLGESPSVWDEVLAKLRLSQGPNLNEYLYGRVYGVGTKGEMTSLYYGEATANGASTPLIWITVGPLLLVVLWLVLRRFGYEVGTLVGIAIWRGSLGGLFSILPALFIQLTLIIMFSRQATSRRIA